ncbi:MAG: hypothetical protein CL858_20270 [Cupriavidus sp.]|jgi:hypothetical protein|uniref:hypothetical protein n=1 Tax=Cupriavidus pauculus TaxID=82633 RepID=UPI000784BFB1|nr:hypothetical protein [Cupriavidus pauculus]MBU67753.1 hypothetical protein [Cupriavidus sp.]KAB0602156.1 hypothetical protein F7R19_13760 [Cupriavidus pauculus]MBY4732942.1 hypothetical protein [Cupriavidus pauculus]MCM3605471.1 hypothetical protein [Cupriavidus pauculus]UAL02529.1 hypothetical protein K8O84_27695 [Cupriavidus pauculus]
MARLLALVAWVPLLGGCAGAPAFGLFGAYFPLWLLSALVGIVGAVISWRIFVATGWAQIVRLQLLVNTAIGLMIAEIVWLIGTGHIL